MNVSLTLQNFTRPNGLGPRPNLLESHSAELPRPLANLPREPFCTCKYGFLGKPDEGLGSFVEGATLPGENTNTVQCTNQFLHNTKIHNIHSKSKPKSCIASTKWLSDCAKSYTNRTRLSHFQSFILRFLMLSKQKQT